MKENVFKDHQITVVCDNERVKQFVFRRPDTGMYGFRLTTGDNLIVMTGDIGEMLVTPGYGRDGLAFMRGSLNSESYFLSKIPYKFTEALKEYHREYALIDMLEWRKEGYITDKQHDEFMEGLSHEDGSYGQMKYYELCHELGIEEPPRATRLAPQARIQLDGMKAFMKVLDSASFSESNQDDVQGEK